MEKPCLDKKKKKVAQEFGQNRQTDRSDSTTEEWEAGNVEWRADPFLTSVEWKRGGRFGGDVQLVPL